MYAGDILYFLSIKHKLSKLIGLIAQCFKTTSYKNSSFTSEQPLRHLKFKRYSKGKGKFNSIYYINTDEIPGEVSRENMISSLVKITRY